MNMLNIPPSRHEQSLDTDAHPPKKPCPDDAALSVVLARVVAQLADAAELSRALDIIVGRHVVDILAKDHHESSQLQNLDRLTQILADIATFLDQIGRDIPADFAIDLTSATRGLRLAGLSADLRGVAHSGAKTGDAEIFAP